MNKEKPLPVQPLLPLDSLVHVRRMDVLIALGVSMILTSIGFFWLYPLAGHNPVAIYRSMAIDPFHYYEKPYGTRMLTPLIVHYLPIDPDKGLRLVAFVSFILSGSFLFLLFRLLGVVPWLAAAMLPGFYFAPTVKFIITHSWFIDPMNYWLLILVFIGLLTANTGVTAAALTLGAFNRPESLSVLPLVFIAWWRVDDPFRSLKPIIISSLPALITGLSLVILWPLLSDLQVLIEIGGTGISTNSQDLMAIFKNHTGFNGFDASMNFWQKMTASVKLLFFSIQFLFSSQIHREILPYFWGLAAIGFWTLSTRIRILCLTHIGLSVLPMLVAIDFFRLPFYAFPAVLLLAGFGIVSLTKIDVRLAGAYVVLSWLFLAFAPFSIWLGLILAVVIVGLYLFLSKKSDSNEESGTFDRAEN